MQDFTKIVRLGTAPVGRAFVSIYCKVKFTNGRLSITGVEGPTRGGNCRGGCGQIDLSYSKPGAIEQIKPAAGWTHDLIRRFFEAWRQWHLNDMVAGSPAQMADLDTLPAEFRDSLTYEGRCAYLETRGLNPDPSYLHDGKPYAYGSAWLRVEVPADVLSFLSSLPDADKAPAWV